MTAAQMETFREAMGDPRRPRMGSVRRPFDAAESRSAPSSTACPSREKGSRRYAAPPVAVPDALAFPAQPVASTQQGFGQILNELAREKSPLADRIVTTSPDVTVSTNLGPFVNRRGLFGREALADVFKRERIPSTFTWDMSPTGQHFELGIAENNLFLLLAALGLSHSLSASGSFRSARSTIPSSRAASMR